MSRVVRMELSDASIDLAIKTVQAERIWLQAKAMELCERLATIGATVATLQMSRAAYSGTKDTEITVEPNGNGYTVRADGEAVLFIEFGAGITYGRGHPEAGAYGMGPGTYPNGKGHWDDPKGWWLPKDKGGGHTYGNPPAAPMYNAVKTIEQQVAAVVKEVFAR